MSLVNAKQSHYQLIDKWTNINFFDNVDFFTGADPTNGFVKYVDRSYALAHNMISTGKDANILMKVNNYSLAPNGRESVRVSSKRKIGHGLVLVDMLHLPIGCGSWPSIWFYGPNWPNNGEVDIIEGINDSQYNQINLHTTPGCDFAGIAQNQTYVMRNTNCTSNGGDDAFGCASMGPDGSFGPKINEQKGGVYAFQFEKDYIRIWIWPREEIPVDVLRGIPNPSNWGIPVSHFPFGHHCPAKKFNDLTMVINTSFCGNWAGKMYRYSSCPLDCVSFVGGDPSRFDETYWEFRSIKFYEMERIRPLPHW